MRRVLFVVLPLAGIAAMTWAAIWGTGIGRVVAVIGLTLLSLVAVWFGRELEDVGVVVLDPHGEPPDIGAIAWYAKTVTDIAAAEGAALADHDPEMAQQFLGELQEANRELDLRDNLSRRFDS